MVKLPPGQQEVYVHSEPAAYAPVNGAWGRQGCTYLNLDAVKEVTVRAALGEAWQDAAQKKPAQKKVKSRSVSPTTSSPRRRSP